MGFAGRFRIEPGTKVRLTDLATTHGGTRSRDAAEARTKRNVQRLSELQYLLYANAAASLLVVLQGPDASGKNGLIRHVFSGLNPQGIKVTPFGMPTSEEERHDFLWRVHPHAPAKGEIAVFNRSHYEAVLVERVHGIAPAEEIDRRYAMINSFEEMLAQNGTQILKFYLHISPDEQLERFKRRLDDKRRRWKIDEADYADRKLWARFEEAGNIMLERTSTGAAPWYVIPSDHKWYRNYAVSRIVLRSLKMIRLTVPPAKADIGEIRREHHEAQDAS